MSLLYQSAMSLLYQRSYTYTSSQTFLEGEMSDTSTYLGKITCTLFATMVVIQLPIVFVLMWGMIAESGVVLSVGRAINILIISPWYGNSIILYHSSFGVLVVPKKEHK